MVTVPGRGRCWHAAAALDAGTTVVSEAPPLQAVPLRGGDGRFLACCSSDCFVATAGCEMLRCSSCKDALYCSRPCQQRDWPGHKAECQRLRRVRQCDRRASCRALFDVGMSNHRACARRGMFTSHCVLCARSPCVVVCLLRWWSSDPLCDRVLLVFVVACALRVCVCVPVCVCIAVSVSACVYVCVRM